MNFFKFFNPENWRKRSKKQSGQPDLQPDLQKAATRDKAETEATRKRKRNWGDPAALAAEDRRHRRASSRLVNDMHARAYNYKGWCINNSWIQDIYP